MTPVPYRWARMTPVPYRWARTTPVSYRWARTTPVSYRWASRTPVPSTRARMTPVPYRWARTTPVAYRWARKTPVTYRWARMTPVTYRWACMTPVPYRWARMTPVPYRWARNLEADCGRSGTERRTWVTSEICGLLGYYTASCGNCLPTFRNNVSVASSRVKIPQKTANFINIAAEDWIQGWVTNTAITTTTAIATATVILFLWRRAPQQTLRTHRSLKAYCATLWWR
jgi:hypothetical protein